MKRLSAILVTVAIAAAPRASAGPPEGGHASAGPPHGGRDVAAELQDARATFSVGTATATRGKTARGVLKVPAGADPGYDIAVAVVHGAKPGPVLAILSGAHGTEYASIVAVSRLVDAVDPAA